MADGGRLRPCPFCGESTYLAVAHYASCDRYAVLCGACASTGARARTENEAADTWNHRAGEQQEAELLVDRLGGAR
jgi:Lar family restriction alleviation protein